MPNEGQRNEFELRKLGLVTTSVMNERALKRADLVNLSSEFEIIILDISILLNRTMVNASQSDLLAFRRLVIASWAELSTVLDVEGLHAVLECGMPGPIANKIVRRCKKLGILSFQLRDGALPHPPLVKRIAFRILDSLTSHNKESSQAPTLDFSGDQSSVFRVAVSFIKTPIWQISGFFFSRPNVCFFAGSKSLDLPARFAKKLVPMTSFDMEEIQGAATDKKSGYLIFIDEEFAEPDAHDYRVLKLRPPVSPETYYPWLIAALHAISEQYGLPVIIALRPQKDASRLSQRKKRFAGFTILNGSSVLALPSCSGIIFHGSTLSLVALEVNAVPIPLEIDLPNLRLKNAFTRSFAREFGVTTSNGILDPPPKKIRNASHTAPEKLKFKVRSRFLGPSDRSREGLISSIILEDVRENQRMSLKGTASQSRKKY